jgi:plasmid stabilization system protein ParE
MKARLKVNISLAVQRSLFEVWQFNAKRNGLTRADHYDDFLRKGIDELAIKYSDGKKVDGHPNLRFATLKVRSRGDGHVVVYMIAETVEVLHLFHTKQDWQSQF